MTFAWVTYANSKIYLDAAIVLFNTLHMYQTKYECVLLLPDRMTNTCDVPSYITTRIVEPFNVPGDMHVHNRYSACSNKIHCWALIEYTKICWLDSDIVVTQNIDDIFDTEFDQSGIAAARGCKCNIFNNIALPTLPHLCPFTNPKTCYINTGVVLLHPSISIYDQLLRADYNHPFADQDTFNIFFEGKITVLDSRYNYLNHLHIAHPDVATFNICIYHFGYGKPWDDESTHLCYGTEYYAMWKKLALLQNERTNH